MMALSAACVALAACGALLALRSHTSAPRHLAAIFVCLAGLAGFPLTVALNRELAFWHLPWLLPLLLALSPSVYFYVRARTAGLGFQAADWRHGALPSAGAVVALGVLALPEAARMTLLGDGALPPGWVPRALVLLAFVLIVAAPFVSFGYLRASVKRLRAHRRWLKDHLSNLERRELRWIDGLIACLVGLWALAALAILSDNLAGGLLVSGEWVLAMAAATLMVMLAFALIPEAVDGQAPPVTEPQEASPPREKYQRSALSPVHAEALADKLDAAMRDDALYLDPNLSLDKLARHVRGAPDHVSQTLNVYMGTTFFDYVSRWRVEAAKDLLASSRSSVLEIAIDVGFNSRSTFYKAFKRQIGVTPSAFRAQRRESAAGESV